MRLRTKANEKAAYDALARALGRAWKELPKAKDDVDSDGKVEGQPLDDARAVLGRFFNNDETYAFDLWCERQGTQKATLVIYFEARGRNPPIWLAMDNRGTAFSVAKQLPRGALLAVNRAADAIDE